MKIILFLPVLIITGCMNLSLDGEMENGSESFVGTVTSTIEENGRDKNIGCVTLQSCKNIFIETDKGVNCKGDITYSSANKGAGILTCDDGRSGSFKIFVLNASGIGKGKGKLGESKFEFTFGW